MSMLLTGVGSSSAPFVGALDAFEADLAVALSVESRLLGSYSGPLFRVRRSSDNTEQDIGFTAFGGLDIVSLATFVGLNSAYIVTLYDQSGNGKDATQSTAANQPRIVNAGAIESTGALYSSDQWLDIASAPYSDYSDAGTSLQIVARQTRIGGGQHQLFNFGEYQINAWVLYGSEMYWDAPITGGRIYFEPLGFTGNEKLVSFERDGLTSRIRIDGSVDHSGAVSGSISGTSVFRLGGNTGGVSFYNGNIKNFCIWKTADATTAAARAAAL